MITTKKKKRNPVGTAYLWKEISVVIGYILFQNCLLFIVIENLIGFIKSFVKFQFEC
jgi:hypothetical protein